MAIPALTAAARFLLAKGTREAVKKYGRAAVTKARALIKRRDKAPKKKETALQGGELPPERRGLPERYRDLDRPLPWTKTKEAQKFAQQHTTERAARTARSTEWQEAQRLADSPPQQAITAVKKPTFKKGGKVRGDGIAQRGHTKGRIV